MRFLGRLMFASRKRPILRVVLCVAALGPACGCSSSDSGLPTRFGDCASPPCEVSLEAFTDNPIGISCEHSRDAVDLSCTTTNQLLLTDTCGDYWAVRFVYEPFTGDFYECIYDANRGELVGAKWSPDNHPVQFAGVQLPASCSLSNVCGVPVFDVCIALGDQDALALREAECQLAAQDAGFTSGWLRRPIPEEPQPMCPTGELVWLCFGY